MRIDHDIEPLVRAAFAASVAEEPDRFGNALHAIADDDGVAARCLALAYAVDVGALLAVQVGEPVDEARLEYLAQAFASTQAWSNVDQVTARVFLGALAEGSSPVDALEPGAAAIAAFALGGWLLSAFPLEPGQRWTDLLDAILDRLERDPRIA